MLAWHITVYRFIKAIVERIKITINQINMFLLIGDKDQVTDYSSSVLGWAAEESLLRTG